MDTIKEAQLANFIKTIDFDAPALDFERRRITNNPLRDIIRHFEDEGVHHSKSGMTAEPVMKWCQYTGQNFRLTYSGKYRAFIVRKVSDDEVDADAKPPV